MLALRERLRLVLNQNQVHCAIGMRPGEILEVITTDPMSVVDMPVFCTQAGHTIVREERLDNRFVFTVERGAGESEG